MGRPYVIAVDLGGTNMRLGVVDSAGNVLCRRRLATAPADSNGEIAERLSTAIASFTSANRRFSSPLAVAVGFAGPTNSADGFVYCAPNVGRLKRLPLGLSLEGLLGMRVFVGNDANCAALGEYWLGAGRGAKSLFLFTLGTGVGGSFVVDGRVWEGRDGTAGEVGHTVIQVDGPVCNCGGRGCLEALVSATAIVRDYRALAGERKARPDAITARMVVARAGRGDATARRVVTSAGRALGIGLGNVFNLLNPDLILVGGGVSRAGAMLLDPAVKTARGVVFGPLRGRLRVERTALGDDAGILGAGRMAFARLGLACGREGRAR